MAKNALKDLTACLHYSVDDWELMGEMVFEVIHIYIYIHCIYDDPKVEADASTAIHQLKHGILEEVGYNKV